MLASAFQNVHDFFHSTTWYLIRNLTIFVVIVFWLSSAFWVLKDARQRVTDHWLAGLAALLGLGVPFLGPLIYMLFRPSEYLADRRERELEIRSIERRLAEAPPACPVCRHPVQGDFRVCPVCQTRLKDPCTGCQRPLEPLWQVCPYCETPVAGATVTALPGRAPAPVAPSPVAATPVPPSTPVPQIAPPKPSGPPATQPS